MDAAAANARRDEAVLLDVREPHEWAAGHIEGALHIPMGQLGQRLSEVPQDRLVVCVCRSGHRSGLVTDAMVRAGYQAENLDGGMLGWVAAKLPIVTPSGGEGTVL